MSHCPLQLLLLGWGSTACRVWSAHPLQGPEGAAEPSIFTLGGVGVLLLVLNPPRAGRHCSAVLPLPPGSAWLGFPGAAVAQSEAEFPPCLLTLPRRGVLVVLPMGTGSILWSWQRPRASLQSCAAQGAAPQAPGAASLPDPAEASPCCHH